MDLNVIHNRILDICRKERLAIPTRATIDGYLDLAQLEEFEDIYSKYGISNDSHDALAPFKVYYPFTSASNGLVTFPTDYLHLISVYTITYDNLLMASVRHKVQFVNEDKLQNALNSQVRPVSITRPIATSNSTSIVLFPQVTQSGALTYFKRPQIPQFVYTETGRTINYDPVNSKQLLWSDIYVNRIIAKTISYIGLTLNDQQLLQYGMIKERETN